MISQEVYCVAPPSTTMPNSSQVAPESPGSATGGHRPPHVERQPTLNSLQKLRSLHRRTSLDVSHSEAGCDLALKTVASHRGFCMAVTRKSQSVSRMAVGLPTKVMIKVNAFFGTSDLAVAKPHMQMR
uniref:Phosphotransferase n=1 Tax=Panagrellus redivivus TaxID=6233 RepID=A0A7E5A191_PANRE